MPPVRETSHGGCALVASHWEPQPSSSNDKLSTRPQSLGANGNDVEWRKVACNSLDNKNTNNSVPVNKANGASTDNPWGPVFHNRQHFNDMHFF